MKTSSDILLEMIPVASAPDDVRELLFDHLYGPWGVNPDEDWLCEGDGGEFVIARSTDGTLLGSARIMPSNSSTPHPIPAQCDGERCLRQIVVFPNQRGQGIGSILMQAVEARAAQLGAKQVGMSARQEAYDFYRRCGYFFVGEEFVSPLTHIPHTHMSKVL